MTLDQDFRSDKSESPEGHGKSRGRWDAFYDRIPEETLGEAFTSSSNRTSLQALPEDIRDDVSDSVLEDSELIGFWIAWNLAGGFANLVAAGWHRATIFRKVRRFRAAFGVHPDDFTFDWIKLDLEKAWSDDIKRRLARSGAEGRS